MKKKKIGKVYLVGSGPGDEELITLKGIRCIQDADTIVYDYLANRYFLKYAKEDAEIIYVGKRIGQHTFEQGNINKLLVEKASDGKIVARLKGGDPFVFGRGGEEALVLKKHKIPFEIVPGVTSPISVPMYAGIPVTHRGLSSSVAFVTGHEELKKKISQVKWQKLAQSVDTLVILMGMSNLPDITEELLRGGLSPDKKAAVIQWGTTPSQRTVTGRLSSICENAKKQGLSSPSIVVIGSVVGLREKLRWFEKKPLFGKKVLVTRPEEQSEEIIGKLMNEGADVIRFPMIKIVPHHSWKEVDKAIKQIGKYDWLVFTSVNGVTYFFKRFFKNFDDIRELSGIKIAAIGSATEKMISDMHLKVALKPKKYTSKSLFESFSKLRTIKNKRFLLPRAQIAGTFLSDELKKRGAVVDNLVCYRTVPVKDYDGEAVDLLKNGQIDAVTFTSSSTVDSFVSMAKMNGLLSGIPDLPVISIGPETTRAAAGYGFNIVKEAEVSNVDGLFESIKEFLQKK